VKSTLTAERRSAPQDGRPARASRAEQLQVAVLGPFEIRLGDEAVEVRGPKRQALVALLALRGARGASVQMLVDALWHDDAEVDGLPAAPRNAIQHHVARLRLALGPGRIESSPAGYALAGAEVDAARFEERLLAARAASRRGDAGAALASAEAALSLWRGRPLARLPAARWAELEARRLHNLRADALEVRHDAALALGRHADVAAAVRPELEEHPFRERLWAQLMLALYRSGDRAEALAAYGEAERLLRERLGLEPGPELAQLRRAILARDPRIAVPLPPRRRSRLPAALASFVGREAELASVRRLLGEHRLVTITGPPGVGKSRLALEAARSLEADAPGGLWLVDLAGADRRTGAATLVGRTVADLRDGRALLVLDGCHAARDEAVAVAAGVLAECHRRPRARDEPCCARRRA